jgi:hypothetical protein
MRFENVEAGAAQLRADRKQCASRLDHAAELAQRYLDRAGLVVNE